MARDAAAFTIQQSFRSHLHRRQGGSQHLGGVEEGSDSGMEEGSDDEDSGMEEGSDDEDSGMEEGSDDEDSGMEEGSLEEDSVASMASLDREALAMVRAATKIQRAFRSSRMQRDLDQYHTRNKSARVLQHFFHKIARKAKNAPGPARRTFDDEERL